MEEQCFQGALPVLPSLLASSTQEHQPRMALLTISWAPATTGLFTDEFCGVFSQLRFFSSKMTLPCVRLT